MKSAILMMAAALTAAAAPGDSAAWTNVESLAPGQKLEVVDMQLKSYRGQFTAASADDLTLATASGPMVLKRAGIMRVSSREHSKRARNALIGAAIGGGAALVGAGIADKRFSNEGREHIAKTIFVPIGLGVGAALGAATPQFQTIYRAHPAAIKAAQKRN